MYTSAVLSKCTSGGMNQHFAFFLIDSGVAGILPPQATPPSEIPGVQVSSISFRFADQISENGPNRWCIPPPVARQSCCHSENTQMFAPNAWYTLTGVAEKSHLEGIILRCIVYRSTEPWMTTPLTTSRPKSKPKPPTSDTGFG